MTAVPATFPSSPDPTGADLTWLPATPTFSPPSAIVSLARLDRVDLRFEIGDRTPEEIGALAGRVEALLDDVSPSIGVANVLTGIEKLAARFGLELPDADVLEADVLEMAGWPAEEWIAGFRGVWSSFRSGYRRFPTVGDFRAAAGQAATGRQQRVAALRRLAAALRQEQQLRVREIDFRRRQREREADIAVRQQAAALCPPAPAQKEAPKMPGMQRTMEEEDSTAVPPALFRRPGPSTGDGSRHIFVCSRDAVPTHPSGTADRIKYEHTLVCGGQPYHKSNKRLRFRIKWKRLNFYVNKKSGLPHCQTAPRSPVLFHYSKTLMEMHLSKSLIFSWRRIGAGGKMTPHFKGLKRSRTAVSCRPTVLRSSIRNPCAGIC